MYRVRTSWANSGSQLGAFEILANAKALVDKKTGYSVYEDDGKRIYPHRVTVPALATTGGVRKVRLDGKETTIWKQSVLTGTYATQLKKHGCGSCCVAMAACINCVETTPEAVMKLAVQLWGKPGTGQSYALSAKGAATLLKKLGVTATAYTVTAANLTTMRTTIKKALQTGKQVICFTHKYDSNDPFANGDHYVMAVGYNKADKIVVANSGGPGRIQYVGLTKLMTYIYHSGTGKDNTWLKSSAGSAGVIIVG